MLQKDITSPSNTTTFPRSATHLAKAITVGAICVSLLSVGALPAFAGNSHGGGKTVHKVQKKVKASTRGGIRTGGSNSRASVNNGIHVNVGGSGGGSARAVISRGGNNGGNHKNNNHKNSKKKVIRVKKVKNIDNSYSYVDNSYVDNSYTDDSYTENNVEQTIKNTYTVKQPTHYDESDKWGDYSDDCGCWSDSGNKPTKVVNENYNTNDNYNSQSVEIYN